LAKKPWGGERGWSHLGLAPGEEGDRRSQKTWQQNGAEGKKHVLAGARVQSHGNWSEKPEGSGSEKRQKPDKCGGRQKNAN